MRKILILLVTAFCVWACDPEISDKGVVVSVKHVKHSFQGKAYMYKVQVEVDRFNGNYILFHSNDEYEPGDTIILTKLY